jgi:hypothetical protein
MTAVEDHSLALRRHFPMDTPQVVVLALIDARRFEGDAADSEWIEAPKHAAHGAIFATGVHTLQDYQ